MGSRAEHGAGEEETPERGGRDREAVLLFPLPTPCSPPHSLEGFAPATPGLNLAHSYVVFGPELFLMGKFYMKFQVSSFSWKTDRSATLGPHSPTGT